MIPGVKKKKSAKIRALENKIKRLQNEIDALVASKFMPEYELPFKAYSLYKDNATKKFYMATIKYDLDSKFAKVVDVKYMSDNYMRAEYDFGKHLAKTGIENIKNIINARKIVKKENENVGEVHNVPEGQQTTTSESEG